MVCVTPSDDIFFFFSLKNCGFPNAEEVREDCLYYLKNDRKSYKRTPPLEMGRF